MWLAEIVSSRSSQTSERDKEANACRALNARIEVRKHMEWMFNSVLVGSGRIFRRR